MTHPLQRTKPCHKAPIETQHTGKAVTASTLSPRRQRAPQTLLADLERAPHQRVRARQRGSWQTLWSRAASRGKASGQVAPCTEPCREETHKERQRERREERGGEHQQSRERREHRERPKPSSTPKVEGKAPATFQNGLRDRFLISTGLRPESRDQLEGRIDRARRIQGPPHAPIGIGRVGGTSEWRWIASERACFRQRMYQTSRSMRAKDIRCLPGG